jgi:hypothetical protein
MISGNGSTIDCIHTIFMPILLAYYHLADPEMIMYGRR